MSGDNITRIGPVNVDLGDPKFQWKSNPTEQGTRPFQIVGECPWPVGQQLSELVANRDRQMTIAGFTGVLEYVQTDHDLYRPFGGWALLQGCQLDADITSELSNLITVTVDCVHLGEVTFEQVVVTRAAVDRANDFGLTPTPLVGSAFYDEDPDGGPFLIDPGGSRFTREYDSSSPHVTERLTPTTGDARQMTIYANPEADVVYPVLAPDVPGQVAKWITHRGGDCRGHDRRQMLDVFGPSHRFDAITDCLVTNGIIRFWLGNRGLRPFLNVEAIAGGTWRQVGVVTIGGSNDVLVGHRLTKVTPDVTILALAVQGKGEVFVTLHRRERMFHIDNPAGIAPPDWAGTPPTSWGDSAQNGTGPFGNGLDGGGDDAHWSDPVAHWSDPRYRWDGSRVQPEIRFRWPADVAPAALTKVHWIRADAAAADLTAGAGFLTLYDPDGFAIVEVYLDGADAKIKTRVRDVVKLTSAAQTFDAGDDLMLGLRFSTVHGLGLSIRNQAGVVTHLLDATSTDLGVDELYDLGYFVNFSRLGDGTYGDGVWGGVTLYPNGVVDNGMVFEDWLVAGELEALAAASAPLDGLPDPVGRLRWFGPFDAKPFPQLSAESVGRRIDVDVDEHGFQKAVVYLDAGRRNTGVLLAREALCEVPPDQHDQLGSESKQTSRVG